MVIVVIRDHVAAGPGDRGHCKVACVDRRGLPLAGDRRSGAGRMVLPESVVKVRVAV